MPRIRSVHPGFFTDEAYVSLSPLARVFAVGVWIECDDQGVFEWKPVTLKMRLLPADNVSVPDLLKEMLGANVIRQFSVNGSNYGVCRNFQQYQRPKKPNAVHPLPAEFRTYAQGKRASSEPDDDEGGTGSPPASDEKATSSPPVPHKAANNVAEFPSGSRKSSQMEEGGWREGGKKEPPSLRSGPPSKREPIGMRLPEDWLPSPDDTLFAAEAGLNAIAVAAAFRDYWHSRPGKDGRKLDWSATWRNWCRSENTRGRKGLPPPTTNRHEQSVRAMLDDLGLSSPPEPEPEPVRTLQ